MKEMKKNMKMKEKEKRLDNNSWGEAGVEACSLCGSYSFIQWNDSGDARDTTTTIPAKSAQSKKEYIRIFKDSIPEDLWKSYCLGLGLNSSDAALQSFKIYIDPVKDIEVDHYTVAGDLIVDDHD